MEGHWVAVLAVVGYRAVGAGKHGTHHKVRGWASIGLKKLTGGLVRRLEGWKGGESLENTDIACVLLDLYSAADINASKGYFVFKVIQRIVVDMVKL